VAPRKEGPGPDEGGVGRIYSVTGPAVPVTETTIRATTLGREKDPPPRSRDDEDEKKA